MTRSSDSERVRRLNAAIELVRECGVPTEAAVALAKKYGLSRRQAYRYVREAQHVRHLLPVPESKIVFTVKLRESLVQEIRQFATSSGKSISDVVTQALETFLRRGKRRGRT